MWIKPRNENPKIWTSSDKVYEQYKDGSLHPVDMVGLTTDRLDDEGKTYQVGNASVTARLPSFRSPEVPLARPSAQEQAVPDAQIPGDVGYVD